MEFQSSLGLSKTLPQKQKEEGWRGGREKEGRKAPVTNVNISAQVHLGCQHGCVWNQLRDKSLGTPVRDFLSQNN